MASVSEQLLSALDDLETDELKRFKWHLKNHKGISASDLETADAPDTVDLMKRRFGPEEAVKITVEILRKMNHNHLAEELENKHKQVRGVGQGVIVEHCDSGPWRSGGPSQYPPTPPQNVIVRGPLSRVSAWGPEFPAMPQLTTQVTSTNIVPRTRNDFLQYSRQLILDLNTVNKRLHLSESNRVITYTDTEQWYPDHPDRFDRYPQVLCRESVCGRCYWEIEWSGGCVVISVSYKSISRKGLGGECVFGHNDQSWSLICSPDRYSFRHNNIDTVLPVKPISSRIGVNAFIRRTGVNEVIRRIGVNAFSSRIGVYVDLGAGTLSFYSVSDTMSLIHTVHTTFTQTLYPGFGFGSGSSVSLC